MTSDSIVHSSGRKGRGLLTLYALFSFLGTSFPFFFSPSITYLPSSLMLLLAGVTGLMYASRLGQGKSTILVLLVCGYVIGFLALASSPLCPKHGMAVVACFITIPALLPGVGLFLAGLFAVSLGLSGSARDFVLVQIPPALGASLGLLLTYASSHIPVYDEIFLKRFSAEGVEVSSTVLKRQAGYSKLSDFMTTLLRDENLKIQNAEDDFWMLAEGEGSHTSALLTKFNIQKPGKAVWEQSVPSTLLHEFQSMIGDIKGGLILIGASGGAFKQERKWWTKRFDADGRADAEWDVSVGKASSSTRVRRVVATKSGDMYVLEHRDLSSEVSNEWPVRGNLWLKKISPSWSESDGGWERELGPISLESNDSVTMWAGGASSVYIFLFRDGKHYLMKWSSSGEKVWEEPYYPEDGVSSMRFISGKDTGVFVITSDSSRHRTQRWALARFDNNGKEVFRWSKYISLPSGATSVSLHQVYNLAFDDSKDVYIGGNYSSFGDHDQVTGMSWWLSKIRDDGSQISEWNGARNGDRDQQVLSFFSVDSLGNPFVIGRRKGFGSSSESMLGRALGSGYRMFKDDLRASTPVIFDRSVSHVNAVAKDAHASEFFIDPFSSSCGREFSRPLKRNEPDAPQDLQYISNPDQSITFSWRCLDNNPPHMFEWYCCNCRDNRGTLERDLMKPEITIDVKDGNEYSWWASCGKDSFGIQSHSNVAKLGPAGTRAVYRYYEFPIGRATPPGPTPVEHFNMDLEMTRRIRAYRRTLTPAP